MPESVRRKYERRGRRAVAALLALGVVMLAVAIVAATSTMGSITHDTEEVEQTLQRQAAISRLTTYNEQIAAGHRGFLIQPDPAFTRVVIEATSAFRSEEEELEGLLRGAQAQEEKLQRIKQLSEERNQIIEAMFSDPAMAFSRARELDFSRDRGVVITQQIRILAETMSKVEEDELVRRNRAQLASLVQFYVVGGVALALLVTVLLAAVILVLRYNRDLTLAQRGLREAYEGLEEAVETRTAELTRANQEIQRFAYIVSHDLRSPLVNVLGFTSELEEARKILLAHLTSLYAEHPELRDRDALLAVEEDLPEAVGFIRASTEKMDRLINSILELSRQGRRTLAPERLDMSEMVDGIAASLHQLAEDAGARIVVKPIPDVESDRIALEQILSNLVENALKYLSPERSGLVTIEGHREGDTVEIDVIDNGRGIAPVDHERIFELFRRAGTQDQAGEGIGLANVRALAYRLGGTIEVKSDLDQGARFRLSLPAKFSSWEAKT